MQPPNLNINHVSVCILYGADVCTHFVRFCISSMTAGDGAAIKDVVAKGILKHIWAELPSYRPEVQPNPAVYSLVYCDSKLLVHADD